MAKASTFSRGFTLIEILVVIGIIVLLIALAVPALALITGSRSIDRAENNLSAMLGRARADALGLQRDTGVLFFIDPATQGVTGAEVFATDAPLVAADAPLAEVYLDLVPDSDFLPLPKGVMAQVVDNCAFNPIGSTNRADDAYLGYNTTVAQGTPTVVQYGGVILFDSQGRLASRTYAFRGNVGSSVNQTKMFNLLYRKGVNNTTTGTVPDIIPHAILPSTPQTAPRPLLTQRSAFGLVLIDGEAFANNGDLTDPQAVGAIYTSGESGEEKWIDENAVPLMVNRYNGTLVRGE